MKVKQRVAFALSYVSTLAALKLHIVTLVHDVILHIFAQALVEAGRYTLASLL